ncbi:three component ABC system middle component [Tamilnaduibacter salinus]|uniref:three component ABC system middle component n=1 Tax=Tamilnaduibacter salinus TaxID=1484056 RepID=UPI001180A9F9|nr:three component ABC system middle component [Tamilnaduibacter salinus]
MPDRVYSQEEFSLFNPAYTGFLLLTMVREHVRESQTGMHCALPFLLVPMALNPTISNRLPSNKRSSLLAWISTNQGELIEFPELAQSFQPFVIHAIAFLMEKSLINLNDEGDFQLGTSTVPQTPSLFSKNESMNNTLRRARFLGRWFAHAPPVETLYAHLGVRP